MVRGTQIGGLVAVLALLGAALAAAARAQAPSYPNAVVLVSGFHTSTPFTTPDPSCAGREGETWSPQTGVAAALRAAGMSVFTAPAGLGGDAPAPCAPGGSPLPPLGTTINTQGDLDANGAALANFLAFLRDSYGVRNVNLVGHSNGGQWSRSALTQNQPYLGIRVGSLTTLGTPYTGSFVADLGVGLLNAQCDFSNPVEQRVCEAVHDLLELVASDIGSIALQEATHEYEASWNPEQTIGRCPVTTIAGTFLQIPLLPLQYYNPSDGVVGEASALAQRSLDFELEPIPAPDIPGLREGGTFPVVHSPVLSFLTTKNLLNQQPISNLVAQTVAATPTDSFCNVIQATPARARAAGRRSARPLRMRLPLVLPEAPDRRGRLAKPERGEAVFVAAGTTVTCEGRRLVPVPMLGHTRLRLVQPGACERRLRVRGRGGRRGRAVLASRHRRNTIALEVAGRRVRVRVRGPSVRRLRAHVRTGRRWRALKLDRRGRGRLPAADPLAIRIRADTRPGWRRATATAVLAPRYHAG